MPLLLWIGCAFIFGALAERARRDNDEHEDRLAALEADADAREEADRAERAERAALETH